MNIQIADATISQDESGESRISVGNLATNQGLGSNVSVWGASEGFVGLPNPPTTSQPPSNCQVLVGTSGNIRIAFAPRDERYRQKVGVLAPGDRAITSNADVGLLLQQAINVIQLLAVAQGLSVKLDAANKVITLTGVNTSIEMSQAALVLAYNDGVNVASIILSASGMNVTTVPPSSIKVNGVPVT